MKYRNIIEKLIENQEVESVLKRDSQDKKSVKALQHLLYELGFDDHLNWIKFRADGDYGNSTVNAVKAFASKNDLQSNGESVSTQIAKKIIQLFDIVDDMRHLKNAIAHDKVEQFYYINTSVATAAISLETLLNELGYGEQLEWEKYGADGKYGKATASAVAKFAASEGIESDGGKVSKELAQKILDKFTGYYGTKWDKETGKAAEKKRGNLRIKETVEKSRKRVYVWDDMNKVRFTSFKKGVYAFGTKKPHDFITENKDTLGQLPGLTDSLINVMVAVAENEGQLDAINTWDNSYMTFGMFQWTIGAGKNPGELAALINKIKQSNPDIYEKYFGQYGIDVTDVNGFTGYVTLDGTKLVTPEQKRKLRSVEWAFRFSVAGQDTIIRSMEVQHAASRIRLFYKSKGYIVKNNYISDIITSEYGIGLLLDNHVNRPGYVKPCLEKAMDVTGLDNPKNWSTNEERKIIDAYLKIRETHGRYPMTHAKKRAAVTKKYLDRKIISDERGSFDFQL